MLRLWKRGLKLARKEQDEASLLYQALKMPVQQPVLGTGLKAKKLEPNYLKKLELEYENIEKLKNQDLALRNQKLQPLLEKPSLHTLTELIHVNAITKRSHEAQQAFDKIIEHGLQPDTVAYNHLMNAYAQESNLQKALEIFQQLQQESKADLVSYATLIKACVKNGELDAGFKLMQDMKSKQIQPNLIIFTNLIHGCLQKGLVERAWSTFDHLKSEIQLPDSITYNLMIYACSKTQDAEKALDLFQEMSDNRLPVSATTFNGLIAACGSRPDYYEQSFSILEQMAAQDFEPDFQTFKVLLQATARNGDVVRGRMVWNDLVSRIDPEDTKYDHAIEPLTINDQVLSTMLQLYGEAMYLYEKGKRYEITDSEKPEHELGLEQAPVNLEQLEKESQRIWDMVKSQHQEGKLKMTTDLLNKRLLTLLRGKFGVGLENGKAFLQEYERYGLQKNGRTYQMLIESTCNKHFFDQCLEYWQAFKQYDLEQEQRMVQEPQKTNEPVLAEKEREQVRLLEGRGSKQVRKLFMTMARGHARKEDVVKALDTMQEAREFRYSGYLAPATYKDVPRVVELCQSMADKGNWDHLQKLQDLCPPSKDPMRQVYKVLGEKTMPKNWWGWSSIGISDQDRKRFARMHQRQVKKTMQSIGSKQQKASRSLQRNGTAERPAKD
ncbi:hypothetical protein EDD86DRAFT_127079 [Gorgonomyces haynaldii]|nr:hypothetical protein EDD86DRAFT_127079 [Gorgonomyces haynaldii]